MPDLLPAVPLDPLQQRPQGLLLLAPQPRLLEPASQAPARRQLAQLGRCPLSLFLGEEGCSRGVFMLK